MSADPPTRRTRKPGKRALAAERKWSEPEILDALEAEPLTAFRRALGALGTVPGLPPDEANVRRLAGLLPALDLPPAVADVVQAVGRAIASWRCHHHLPVSAEAHAWEHLELAALAGPGIVGRVVHFNVLPPMCGRDFDPDLSSDPNLQIIVAVRKREAKLLRLHAEEDARADAAAKLSEVRAVAAAAGGRAGCVPAAIVEGWRARARELWAVSPAASARAIAKAIDPRQADTIRRKIAGAQPPKLAGSKPRR